MGFYCEQMYQNLSNLMPLPLGDLGSDLQCAEDTCLLITWSF